ncbi:unnamed protein product [Spirodela intermedia]|uniref:Saposin B-type domain-containing protein n=1 Tax=Spirodela intermedia TaxID=51605 RepID=A0A7I8IV34_SPIIN|nr:unnamed protein product [Spirodela intermedia]CAA6661865.1 unnamed protein product [Spirodela intermedia]
MGTRLGLPLLTLLVFGCVYCDARKLEASGVAENLEEYEMNRRFCGLCEQFAGQAVEYMKENKTQVEVIDIFHKVCFRLHSFQQQCSILVDYYAPLFFVEVSSMSPHDFCTKMNFCKHIPSPPPGSSPPAAELSPPPSSAPSPSSLKDPMSGEHICEICHNTVFRVLNRLKDPGTELRIVERLVKGCVVVDHFADKCQSLIFQYGPVILVNAVRLLERADLCVTLRACPNGKNETAVAYSSSSVPLLPLFEDM